MNRFVVQIIDLWTRWTVRLMLSFLWAAASLFVVTGGAATVALVVGARRADDGYGAAAAAFARAFGRNLVPGFLVGLPVLLCTAVTWLDVGALAHFSNFTLTVLYAGLLVAGDVVVTGCAANGLARLAQSERPPAARQLAGYMCKGWLYKPWPTLGTVVLWGFCALLTGLSVTVGWTAPAVLCDGLIVLWSVGALGDKR